MAPLQVDVVAADRKVWSGEASAVFARTVDGELGILPGHQPLLGILIEGELRVDTGSGKQTATIDSGFLSVDHDRVTIVADQVDSTSMQQG